jgi:hypothetical protein
MFNVMYDETLAVVFFEKSNCTQVVSTFLDRLGLLEEATRYSDWLHDYRINVWLRNGKYITLDTLKGMDVPRLKFIRNPYHRCMSMYTHFLSVPSATLPNLPKLPRPTVDQFLRALLVVPHVRGQAGAVDAHFCSQRMVGESASMWTEIIDVDSLRCARQRRRLKRTYNLSFDDTFKSKHWKHSDSAPLGDPDILRLIRAIFPEDVAEFNAVRYKAEI